MAAPEPPRRAAVIASPNLGDDVVVGSDDLLDGSTVTDLELQDHALTDGEPVVELDLRRVRLLRPAWTGTTFTRLALTDVVVDGGELSGVTFDAGTFLRVAFVRCRMSGVVAPALRGTDVTFVDCQMDGAWLRAAELERCAFEDCRLPGADLYAAKLTRSRLVRCDLTGLELSQAKLDDVAFHGSRIDGLMGGDALRNAVIGGDQVIPFAGPVLHAANVRVDDDYLDPRP